MNWMILLLSALMLFGALGAVMASGLLPAAISLAFTSIVLSLMMFLLGAPLAGVFELSVCAGLITVVFVSTISLTRRLSVDDEKVMVRSHMERFVFVPLVLLIITALFVAFGRNVGELPSLPNVTQFNSVRELLWNVRRLDLLGQVLALLAGVFGVIVLFKPEVDKK